MANVLTPSLSHFIFLQVVISSDLSGQLWSACVWDLLTGTTLTTYKATGNGICGARSMTTIGDDYLVASEADKQIINFWSLKERQADKHSKVICPGRVTALAVTPDGAFCVVAVGEKIFIWQVGSFWWWCFNSSCILQRRIKRTGAWNDKTMKSTTTSLHGFLNRNLISTLFLFLFALNPICPLAQHRKIFHNKPMNNKNDKRKNTRSSRPVIRLSCLNATTNQSPVSRQLLTEAISSALARMAWFSSGCCHN